MKKRSDPALKKGSPHRRAKTCGRRMVTAEAHDRDLFSLLKKINIRGFFSHKNLFDDGDRFDIAGSCSEKNAIPLYFIRRDYGRLVPIFP